MLHNLFVFSYNLFLLVSEIEKKEFVKCVLQFLHVFQFCVEHWSKISSDVQKALIDYGAFHLILNEFHTAPSTEVSNI